MYGAKADREKVFDDLRPMITQTVQGFNVCVLLYGASRTGKSFTLEGDGSSAGLLYRSVNAMFEEVGGVDDSLKYEIYLSSLEIVDETIHDLQIEQGTQPPTFTISRHPTYGMQARANTCLLPI